MMDCISSFSLEDKYMGFCVKFICILDIHAFMLLG